MPDDGRRGVHPAEIAAGIPLPDVRQDEALALLDKAVVEGVLPGGKVIFIIFL